MFFEIVMFVNTTLLLFVLYALWRFFTTTKFELKLEKHPRRLKPDGRGKGVFRKKRFLEPYKFKTKEADESCKTGEEVECSGCGEVDCCKAKKE